MAEQTLKYWIGIDGGGTRATAVALDSEGAVVSRVEGGAALIDPTQPLAGAAELARLARRVLDEAGVKGRAAGLCCSLAGAGSRAVQEALASELSRANVAKSIHVTGDAEAALRDAFGEGAGVLLISGTGSIAWARTADGRSVRAGGWGMLLGDEGSGYALGMDALRVVVRAADGREKPTALTAPILKATGAETPGDLITWTAGAGKADIAALAPLVTQAAAGGDACARSITGRAASELAHQVHAVLDRSGPWSLSVPVAFAGGLIAPGRSLREATWKALQSLPYSMHLRAEPVDAARGAALIGQSRG